MLTLPGFRSTSKVNRFRRADRGTARRSRALRPGGLERLEGRALLTSGWALTAGGVGAEIEGRDIAVDSAGYVYVTGDFGGSVDMDPTMTHAGNVDLLTGSNAERLFVAKYNSAGSFLWAAQTTGTGEAHGMQIALTASGDVIVAADRGGSITIDTVNGPETLTGSGNVVLKLRASDGKVTNYGIFPSVGVPMDIALDPGGNIYVADNLRSLTKLNADLTTIAWQRAMTAPLYCVAVSGDGSGTVVVGGESYMARVLPDGTIQQTQQYAVRTWGYAEFIDGGGARHLYSTGTFTGEPLFGSTYLHSRHIAGSFVAELDPATLTPLWTRTTDANNSRRIVSDGDGNLFTTGFFDSSIIDRYNAGAAADFDPGPEAADLTVTGGTGLDAYVMKLDRDGNFQSVRQIGGPPRGPGGFLYTADVGLAVAVDGLGNVYATGTFLGPAQADTGDVQAVTLAGIGKTDMYVVRLDQAPAAGAIFGQVYTDFNNNHQRDDETMGLTGTTVYLDLNNNGVLNSGEPSTQTGYYAGYAFRYLAPGTYHVRQVVPAGWTQSSPAPGGSIDVTVTAGESKVGNIFLDYAPGRSATYSTTKSAKLRDNGSVNFTLKVSDSFTIWDVNLNLDITHANVNELGIELIAPDGTIRNMISYPASGTDLKNITFSDEAAVALGDSSPPYVGAYQPPGVQEAAGLSRFDGKSAKGTWTLRIGDNKSGNSGTLNRWSLDIKGSAGAALAASPASALSTNTSASAGTAPLTQQARAATVDQALARWQPPIGTATVSGDTDLRIGQLPGDEAGSVGTTVGNGAGSLFAERKDRRRFTSSPN